MALMSEAAQTGQLKFLHMSFAPEAQRILAGGGAERNHRKRVEIYSQPRRGDRPASVCRPSRAPEGDFDCVRWFLHRLISGVPPGRRSIPELCRNFSCPVCATFADQFLDEQTLLFTPQRNHRIHLRRPPRGDVAGQQRHECEQRGDAGIGQRISRAYAEQDALHQLRQPQRGQQP